METLDLIAASTAGLEAVVKRELQGLGYEQVHVEQIGRVAFAGDVAAICRGNLHLRCADRVLLRLGSFPAVDFGELFDRTYALPWERWIGPEAMFPVRGRSIRSMLSSVPACQSIVKKAVVEKLRAAHGVAELPETGALCGIEVALLDDTATLTMDTTGPGLNKRGYRKLVGPAPLKETLAAALVLLSFWRPDRPLIDPFCGSGTIPIEAALIGRNIAPGLKRSFAAEGWPQVPAELWQAARQAAQAAVLEDLPVRIIGTDIDEESLSLARYHAEQAGVAGQIHFQQRAFAQLTSKQQYGCVICNPPYGERLSNAAEVEALYRSLPIILRRLRTWSHYILTARKDLEELVGRPADRRRKLYNGRIECTYFQFHGPRPPRKARAEEEGQGQEIAERDENVGEGVGEGEALPADAEMEVAIAEETEYAEQAPLESSHDSAKPQAAHGDTEHEDVSTESIASIASTESTPSIPSTPAARSTRSTEPIQPAFGGLTTHGYEQAEMFRNRLIKRAHHLRKWAARGVTCYRLYDRDIPEVPLAVDWYEGRLHLAEYDRPHDRSPAEHADWLDLMVAAAGEALGVKPADVFLKRRQRQRGLAQYERVAEEGRTFVVSEGGLKFRVNLSDYLDTGLFLDHRITRAMVREEAAGRRVLNLFAYTGAFTVYAAAGGAASTTSVDLSNTYLEWAQDNLALNALAGPKHRFARDDAMNFLRYLPAGQAFDLAVVDPPTFSNSKKTEEDWDIQRDHAALLALLAERMSPGGVIFFSTNFRRFKLDEPTPAGLEAREITRQTLPEDFRNERIHRCWRLVRPAGSAEPGR